MKIFTAEAPNLGTAAVQPFRTREDAATLAAIAAVKAPPSDEVAAELVALAYVHATEGVRKAAQKVMKKHVAYAGELVGWKAMSVGRGHLVEDYVRACTHPARCAIAKAMVFHRWVAVSVPFEEDAAFRGALLDIAIDRAKREDEDLIRIGEIYTEWHGSHGSATSTDLHVFPAELPAELAARRETHPFTGLSIHGGSLTDLPKQVAEMKPWLKHLSLSWQPFTTLPEVLFELTNLEVLELCGTELEDIPPSISRLTKLRHLDLGNGKKMKALPASVCALDQLTSLRIGNGSIRSIPDAFGGMRSLERLEMQSTQVTKLPKTASNLTKLLKIEAKWSDRFDAAAAKAIVGDGVTIET